MRYNSDVCSVWPDEPIVICDDSVLIETRMVWYSYVVLPR